MASVSFFVSYSFDLFFSITDELASFVDSGSPLQHSILNDDACYSLQGYDKSLSFKMLIGNLKKGIRAVHFNYSVPKFVRRETRGEMIFIDIF